MKTKLFLTSLLALTLACNSGPTENLQSNAVFPKSKSVMQNQGKNDTYRLKQYGDYSELFDRKFEQCDLIQANEVAKALKLDTHSVKTLENQFICDYEIYWGEFESDIRISGAEIPKELVLKEVESFHNSKLLEAVISDSGDTWLCHFPSRKAVLIFNQEYGSRIKISYNNLFPNPKPTETQDQQAYESALAVANYLLKKYKK